MLRSHPEARLRLLKDDLAERQNAMMESIAKLVNADKLRVTHTEYELGTEFDEALDHAMEEGRSTKILLKVKDIGVTY